MRMENLIISVNAILPMFLVMALGYGARCLGWIRREEILNINKIAFRIFLPCLLFYNVYCSDLSGSFDPLLIAYAVGGVLVSFALALGYTLLTEKLPERRGVMIQGMFRSNYVIMGIPVATALLGADQLGTVSILIAIIVPIFNMMSIIVLEVFRGQKPKPLHILGQIAKNPLVIASVLGVLALVAKHPPAAHPGADGAERERHRIAAAAVSARRVLPVLRPDGATAASSRPSSVGQADRARRACFWGSARCSASGMRRSCRCIGVFASPTAVNSFTMAQQMGGDAELAGDIVVTTSAASILTMFLWIFLFKSLGMF